MTRFDGYFEDPDQPEAEKACAYIPQDPVLKKDVNFGLQEGFVVRSWLSPVTGEEYVRVKWSGSGRRSTCKAAAVLPHTPENLETLTKRYDQRVTKITNKVAAIMKDRGLTS